MLQLKQKQRKVRELASPRVAYTQLRTALVGRSAGRSVGPLRYVLFLQNKFHGIVKYDYEEMHGFKQKL